MFSVDDPVDAVSLQQEEFELELTAGLFVKQICLLVS